MSAVRTSCRGLSRRWTIITVTVVGGAALMGAALGLHRYRRDAQANAALRDGLAAFEKQDWETARMMLGRYLSRYEDNTDVLRKYAEAQLATRPLPPANIIQAAGAYRRLLRLLPRDDAAFERLALVYESTGNPTELGQIAEGRLQVLPGDARAIVAQSKELLARQKPQEAREQLSGLLKSMADAPANRATRVEVCILLAVAEAQLGAPDAEKRALDRLDEAVKIDSSAAMALVRRAAVERALADKPGAAKADLMAAARADLEKAEAAKSSDPRVPLALSEEWMAHRQLDRAAAQLAVADGLNDRTISSYFVDTVSWTTAKFSQRARLALLSGDKQQSLSVAQAGLATLGTSPQRLSILPLVVELLLQADQVAEARQQLNEYLDAVKAMPPAMVAPESLALLEALVASAEDKPYRVIELLTPVADKPSMPLLAGALLTSAYERTGQARRANKLVAARSGDQQINPLVGRLAVRSALADGQWASALSILDSEPPNDSDVESQVQRLTARAGQALESKQGDAALDELAKQLTALKDRNPKRADIRLLLASIAQARGQSDVAESELKTATVACDDSPQALIALARFYARGGKLQEAEAPLKDACQRFADQAMPWIVLSRLQLEQQRTSDALATLQRGREACHDRRAQRQIDRMTAVVQITRGDRAVGVAGLRRLAADDPNDVDSRVLLLETPDVMKGTAEASALIADLRRIEGETGLKWRLYQARQWQAAPDWNQKSRESIGLLTYCIDADPSWPAPVLALGDLYEQMGDSANAHATYASGVSKTGDEGVANRLLQLLRRQGRFSEGYALAQRMERLLGERVAGAQRMIFALDEGQYDKATTELQMRVSGPTAAPNDLLALASVSYAARHDVSESMRYLEQAAAAGADAVAVARVRMRILDAAGRKDGALAVLDGLVENTPSVDAYMMRGAYLQHLNRADAADKDFEKLAELSKDDRGPAILGEHLAQTGRLDEAIETWERGLATFPDSVTLKRGLAKARFARSKPGDAERMQVLMQQLERSHAEDIDVLALQALNGLRTGTDSALAASRHALQEARQGGPGSAESYRQLSATALMLGDRELAWALAVRGLQFNPNDVGLTLMQAEVSAARGEDDAARTIVQNVLTRDPNQIRAWEIAIGVAARKQDAAFLKQADAKLEQLAAQDPSDEIWPNLRANALVGLGESPRAIEVLAAYRNTEPGERRVRTALHQEALLRSKGDWPAARAILDQATAIAPNEPELRLVRLAHLAHEQQFDEIVAMCEQPTSQPAAAYELMIAAAPLLNQSPAHRAKALALARRAAELQPRNLAAQLTRGLLAYTQGDVSLAEAAYRAALQLDPKQPDALNNLAWLLAHDRNQNDEAWRLSLQAVDQRPDDPELHDTLAYVLKKLGRTADAAKEYRQCIELQPSGSPGRARALAQFALLSGPSKDSQSLAVYLPELESILQKPADLGLSAAEIADLQNRVRAMSVPQ